MSARGLAELWTEVDSEELQEEETTREAPLMLVLMLMMMTTATAPAATLFMVAEHGNVPDGRSCSPLLTSSDVKKDGLMMNKFDMPSAHMSKKSKAAPGVKALKRRPGKRRDLVKTCFENFVHVRLTCRRRRRVMNGESCETTRRADSGDCVDWWMRSKSRRCVEDPWGPGCVKVRRVDGTAREVGGARKPCPKREAKACPAEAGSGAPLRRAPTVSTIGSSCTVALSQVWMIVDQFCKCSGLQQDVCNVRLLGQGDGDAEFERGAASQRAVQRQRRTSRPERLHCTEATQ
eukprot:CAMPEP_0204129816 /NCGR_PEP_ID=MMETSP0361-20130328/12988_1 /ASSEMBLY_ACC=CAM_ASM_000343 /TAXON_ID=268821 /ORGANISM="Scrippsiella Hangoei, Strain SHTV-5" /LENGTH=290 /DNA_ID=CAMNT_0051082281 /DNA_START=130 /DNA_END=1003 /DNA_ORIENTATION=+